MARILFFVFLVFVVWLLVRMLGAKRGRAVDAPAPAPARPSEAMTQCAWCGAHVPTSHAIVVTDGRTYCSVAHRDAAGGSAAP